MSTSVPMFKTLFSLWFFLFCLWAHKHIRAKEDEWWPAQKRAQQVNLLLVTHEDPSVSTETHVIKEEVNYFHRVVSDLHSVLWHACPHNWHSCMCVRTGTHTIKTHYKNMWISNLKIFCFSLQNGNQKLIFYWSILVTRVLVCSVIILFITLFCKLILKELLQRQQWVLP